MARTLLSKQYAEFIDPSQNADKFYLVCVWQESSGAFIGEAHWGRRGSSGSSTEYYRGASRGMADAAVNKKWYEKTGKGYKPTTLPLSLAAILASLGNAAPAAAPAARPATPPAPIYVAVPAPSVITAITAGGMAIWKAALGDPDYVPSQSIDLGDPGIVRAYATFGAGGAQMLAPEPDPAKPGAFRADIARLAPQARLLFSKLDPRKPLYTDTILDCWLWISTTAPVLVVADVLRLDGRDMRSQPFSVRSMLVEQVLGEFEAASQSTGLGWKPLVVLPREQKGSARSGQFWLRRLSATYDPAVPYSLLRLT